MVGFDADMAWFLADDLGVNISFVPIQRDLLVQQLEQGGVDVIMSAFEGTVELAEQLPSTDPYMELTLALVVPDYRKREFQTREQIRNLPKLTFAVIKNSFFAEQAPKIMPRQFNQLELDSPEEFFEHGFDEIDCLVISAEEGYAWTIRYPQFTVTNPANGRIKVPLYYISGDREFDEFLGDWLVLKRTEGTWQTLYDYWVLGIEQRVQQPRWCVIRDVLGWVD